MSSELNGETPTFENVAGLIAKEEADVEWLADALRLWVWPQERWPQSAREYGSGLGMFADMAQSRWARARLIKTLRETLPKAADTLSDLLGDFALFQHLTAEALGPGFGPLERVTLAKATSRDPQAVQRSMSVSSARFRDRIQVRYTSFAAFLTCCR